MMLCPPITTAPAVLTRSDPPRMISVSTSRSSLPLGNPTMFSAVLGSPPIAYTSLKALAAAIWPKVYGSSTIGVKKSTVLTIARSSRRRNTPASSDVSVPTIMSGCSNGGRLCSTCIRSAAPSFAAQPAAATCCVSPSSLIRLRPETLAMVVGFDFPPKWAVLFQRRELCRQSIDRSSGEGWPARPFPSRLSARAPPLAARVAALGRSTAEARGRRTPHPARRPDHV